MNVNKHKYAHIGSALHFQNFRLGGKKRVHIIVSELEPSNYLSYGLFTKKDYHNLTISYLIEGKLNLLNYIDRDSIIDFREDIEITENRIIKLEKDNKIKYEGTMPIGFVINIQNKLIESGMLRSKYIQYVKQSNANLKNNTYITVA